MKAFVQPRAGVDAVQPAEVPVPEIADDELLVRIQAIGVGIQDSYFLPENARYPYPIGIEAAGVVEQAGARVKAHQVGDRIAFVSSMQPKGGTWAEHAAVAATSTILSVPPGMDITESAAVPMAGNTVLRALGDLPAVPSGGSLFIAGASGAIGTLAIQIARRRGWRVAASASPRNHDHLLSMGAELAVDYHDPSWGAQVRSWAPGGVDAAIAVPPGTALASLDVVRDGGKLVTISGDQLAGERGVEVAMVSHQSDVQAELERLMRDVAAARVRVVVEQVYPFDEALAALVKVRSRHARGKQVLRVEDAGV